MAGALFWFGTPLLVGALIGHALGGRFERISMLELRAAWVPIVLFAGQLTTASLPDHQRRVVIAVTYLLLGGWLAWNLTAVSGRARWAGIVFVVGMALNALPILANGFMPVSTAALERVGLGSSVREVEAIAKHATSVPGTVLPWLGDVIPAPYRSFPRWCPSGTWFCGRERRSSWLA